MKSFRKPIVFTILCALGASCAGTNVKEVADSRYKRMDRGEGDTDKPAFFYVSYKPTAGRAPASVAQEVAQETKSSPKEAYFLGLWEQKNKMEAMLAKPSQTICPAFHQTLLDRKNELSQHADYSLEQDWSSLVKGEKVLSNPVLALQTESGLDLYTAIKSEERFEKEWVVEAFEGFYQRTASEVEELCQTGSSEGYFVFANMVRYYSTDRGFMRSEKALKALLKLSPVANAYVLQSLRKDRRPASVKGLEPLESQVLNHLKVSWFQQYLDTLYEVEENEFVSKNSSLRN